MSKWKSIADIRREYGNLSLSEESAQTSPFAQFERWFEEVLKHEKSDPTAMVLSTVDDKGHPDSRVVLLKGLEDGQFIFYTNYQSTKSIQLKHCAFAALNFYWPQMARQVRIRGPVNRVSEEQSDAYFGSRPKASQLSAHASPQSQEIQNRHQLDNALNILIEKYQQETVQRPIHWGGFALTPEEFEFWQGRDNRLHDRIHYFLQAGQWKLRRLAP